MTLLERERKYHYNFNFNLMSSWFFNVRQDNNLSF